MFKGIQHLTWFENQFGSKQREYHLKLKLNTRIRME